MSERNLDQAMGMTADEIAELRERVNRLARPRCYACHRPLPHTDAEDRACPAVRS